MADTTNNELNDAITGINNRLEYLINGNGRKGVHALLDDVYGDSGRTRPGLFARVVLIEAEVQELKMQRRETKFLQRGIAAGVGLVALDSVFGIDLMGVLGALFGG
jgi:hypothetical protein